MSAAARPPFVRTRWHACATLLYLLPIATALSAWEEIIDDPAAPGRSLAWLFTQASTSPQLGWTLVAPMLWAALAVAWTTPIAATRAGTATLFGLGLLSTVGAWIAMNSEIAVYATVALLYPATFVRNAWRSRQPRRRIDVEQ